MHLSIPHCQCSEHLSSHLTLQSTPCQHADWARHRFSCTRPQTPFDLIARSFFHRYAELLTHLAAHIFGLLDPAHDLHLWEAQSRRSILHIDATVIPSRFHLAQFATPDTPDLWKCVLPWSITPHHLHPDDQDTSHVTTLVEANYPRPVIIIRLVLNGAHKTMYTARLNILPPLQQPGLAPTVSPHQHLQIVLDAMVSQQRLVRTSPPFITY